MPASSKSKKKAVSDKKKQGSRKPRYLPETSILGVAGLSGLAAGLSAPGFDFWYLAWFALAPLFMLIASSADWKRVGLRSFTFCFAYSLTYLSWYLELHPLDWLGFSHWQSIGIATFCWLFASTHQALIGLICCLVIRLVPLTGGFFPTMVEGKWKAPALLVVPAVWVILQEKVLNAHNLLGVPWPMIEYSQYKQTAFIQAADLIGGIGIGYLIIMVNLVIAELLATLTAKLSLKSLAAHSQASACIHALVVGLIISACLVYGNSKLAKKEPEPNQQVAIVQGNTNINMQKAERRLTAKQLLDRYTLMLNGRHSDLCVLTENALPVVIKERKDLQEKLRDLARSQKSDIIFGAIEEDYDGNPFNSAFGMNKYGQLLPEAYHKRYLVPVGEYAPAFLKLFPEPLQKLTNTPAGTGFSAGKKPVVLNFAGKQIAPLICFETMAPDLAVSSVRNGGHLLVNLSDLAWFHKSMIGEQMLAFAVFRAIETDRFLIFAANTGPSVVISNHGNLIDKINCGEPGLLIARVSLRKELTTFTQWFH